MKAIATICPSFNDAAVTSNEPAIKPIDGLVRELLANVLPVLQQYFASANFDWRGNLPGVAAQYATELAGKKITANAIRIALESAKTLSLTTKQVPNPRAFMLMCLHARGMATLEQCIAMIEHERNVNYGKNKTWRSPLAYWLNQETFAMREKPAAVYQKCLAERYSDLAIKWAAGELKPVPLLLEYQERPRFEAYGVSDCKSVGEQFLASRRALRAGVMI